MIFRSLLFFLVFYSTLFCICGVSLFYGPFIPLRWRMKVSMLTEKIITFWLKHICNITIEINGVENLVKVQHSQRLGQPHIIVANHQSPWETFYLQSVFYPLSTVLKKELLYIPVFGWSLALLRPIILNRQKAVKSMLATIEQGKQRLRIGNNLLIFPQGTRVAPGQRGNIKRSAAQLAVQATANIVPLVHNAGKHWPAHGLRMKPGVITLTIGAPISCRDRTVAEIANEYTNWMIVGLSEQGQT